MKPLKPICFFLLLFLCIDIVYAGEQPGKKSVTNSKAGKTASDHEIHKNENAVLLPALSYYNRGVVNLAEKNTDDAIADFSLALSLADSAKDLNLSLRAMESLSQAYEASGDNGKALFFTRKYFLLKDSLANAASINTNADLKKEYDESIKLLENAALELDTRIVRGEIENNNLFNYFFLINGLLGLVMLVLILAFVASGRRSKKVVKEYERLLAEEKEAAVSTDINNQVSLDKIGKKFSRHAYTQYSLIRLLSGRQPAGHESSFLEGIRHTNEKMLELSSMFNTASDHGKPVFTDGQGNAGKKYEGPVRVLIISEDEYDRMVLSGTLQKYFTGAEFQAITNLNGINTENFDVIIFDAWSPDSGIDGMIEKVNDLTTKNPEVPVILVSDDESVINDSRGNVAAVLSKPLNDEEFIQAIISYSKRQFNSVDDKAEAVKEEWKDENFQQLFFKQLPQKLQVIEEAVKRGDWKTTKQRILEVRTMLAFTGMELTDPAFNEFDKMDGSVSFMTWHNRTTAFCNRVREKISSLENAASS